MQGLFAMPVRPRRNSGQFVFHVFNRAIQGLVPFQQPGDYEVFLRLVAVASPKFAVRVLAYAVMPNHWHLIAWPSDDSGLSAFMHWLTATHAKRWRAISGTTGRGAVYQSRFKAVAIQRDSHLLRACCYVERNPLRARLVARAEDWPWGSAWEYASGGDREILSTWPLPKPADWVEHLNLPEPPDDLREFRDAIRRGLPFGNVGWRAGTMSRLKWPVSRPVGRPKGSTRLSPRLLARVGRFGPLPNVPSLY